MDSIDAAQLLLFSGGLSILFASFLGVAMLIPMQPWGRKLFQGINFKQAGAAHLDWIMLGLMQGLAAGLIAAFSLSPSNFSVWAMVVGGWMNPLPYLFRAFGINAFAMTGSLLQRFAATLGAFSSALIIIAWASLLTSAWHIWG